VCVGRLRVAAKLCLRDGGEAVCLVMCDVVWCGVVGGNWTSVVGCTGLVCLITNDVRDRQYQRIVSEKGIRSSGWVGRADN